MKNAQTLAASLTKVGFTLVTGGTDNHLLLLDLTNKNIPGKKAAQILDKAGTAEKNSTESRRTLRPISSTRTWKNRQVIFPEYYQEFSRAGPISVLNNDFPARCNLADIFSLATEDKSSF